MTYISSEGRVRHSAVTLAASRGKRWPGRWIDPCKLGFRELRWKRDQESALTERGAHFYSSLFVPQQAGLASLR
jgi:hypothetical protein